MKLIEFPYHPPPYAILSHTWGQPQDEVLFDDMVAGVERARAKEAFTKVENTCRLAQEHGLEYCWIDSCCIDKRSSAELQEAINSMFEWYKSSNICYAYISDVDTSGNPVDNSQTEDSEDAWEDCDSDDDPSGCHSSDDHEFATDAECGHDSTGNSGNTYSSHSEIRFLDQFRRSCWFKRGWTLQELIAPAKVYFYDRDWEFMGSKDGVLAPIIQSITGIPQDFLLGKRPHTEASVAQRMYWASSRETSRKEDVAYCLLGLFVINMPMLYGEGDNAFLRLQLEILNKTDDESIFAWLDPERKNHQAGLLAEHPRYFANSGDIVTEGFHKIRMRSGFDPPAMTSRGLRLQKSVISLSNRLCIIPLRCTFRPRSSIADAHPTRHRPGRPARGGFEATFVISVLAAIYMDTYRRVQVGQFLSTAVDHGLLGQPHTIFISQTRHQSTPAPFDFSMGWIGSLSTTVGYSLEPVPLVQRVLGMEPEVMPVCITDLKLQKWSTLVFTVRYGRAEEAYEIREPPYLADPSSFSLPLLLRYNDEIISTIWIGLHRNMTKLLEWLRPGENFIPSTEKEYFNSQLEVLRKYARANPDTVILPGYKIQAGLNLDDKSIFKSGKVKGTQPWETQRLGLCSRFYSEKLFNYRSAEEYKREHDSNIQIQCEPIPKTEWQSNQAGAVFILSIRRPQDMSELEAYKANALDEDVSESLVQSWIGAVT